MNCNVFQSVTAVESLAPWHRAQLRKFRSPCPVRNGALKTERFVCQHFVVIASE